MSTPSFPSYPYPEDEDNEKQPVDREGVAGLPSDEHVAEQAQLHEPTITEDHLEPQPTAETELPPEAQGETNGGPLGCCLGITVGIMLSLFLGVIGFGHLTANLLVFLIHADPVTNIRIATAFFTVVGALLGGYFGWRIGKLIYREYELSPRQQQRLARLERQYKKRAHSS